MIKTPQEMSFKELMDELWRLALSVVKGALMMLTSTTHFFSLIITWALLRLWVGAQWFEQYILQWEPETPKIFRHTEN